MNHCDRLLALLSDGRPHSYHEIYALRIMGHSRAADLRARGYDIRVEATRNQYGERDYTYQLISRPLPSPGRATPKRSPGDENGQLQLTVGGHATDRDRAEREDRMRDRPAWRGAILSVGEGREPT